MNQYQQETYQDLSQQQSIIDLTINQIDTLTDDAVSQLANNFQQQFDAVRCSPINPTKDYLELQQLQQIIQHSLNQLRQCKLNINLLLSIYLKDKNANKAIEQIEQDSRKFSKILLLRQSQFLMLMFILSNRQKTNFQSQYFKKFGKIQHFIIPPHRAKQFINSVAIRQVLITQIKILQQYIHQIGELKKIIENKYRSKYLIRKLNHLRVISAKISTISQVFPQACLSPKQDLFSYSVEHPRWKKLIAESITYRSFADKQTLKQSFLSFKKNLNLVNAGMSIVNKTRNLPLFNSSSWYQIIRSTKYLVKCALFKDAAEKEAEYMITSANTEMMKQVWNLPQHKIFRDFAEFVLPSIQYSQRFYIPRIMKEYFNSNGKIKFPNTKINFINQYGNEMFNKKQYKQKLRVRINSKFNLISKFQIINQQKKYQAQGRGALMGKIAHISDSTINLFKRQSAQYIPQALIFHIHGGGFISMSSFIHQIYTRIWAKDLQIPIISVDYGKAPQHPYPQGLYDCFEAYIWTIKCFQQIYQAKPKKIIFLGDSAGGNLCTALISLLISWKLPTPDGLVMAYPVLHMSPKKYTKSLLGSLSDLILPHTLLKLCHQSYVKIQDGQNDPLISPLLTPQQILKKFPTTKIFVGSKDPFHDDCCRFIEKINLAKPGIGYLTIFQQFPHGFLQFDIKTHPNQFSRMANKQICQAIRTLLQQQKN